MRLSDHHARKALVVDVNDVNVKVIWAQRLASAGVMRTIYSSSADSG